MTPEELKNSSEHADFRASILDIHHALKGDPMTGDIGLVKKVDAMFEAWTSIIWLGKGIGTLAIFFAAVGTVFATFWQPIKHFITRK